MKAPLGITEKEGGMLNSVSDVRIEIIFIIYESNAEEDNSKVAKTNKSKIFKLDIFCNLDSDR